MRHSYGIRVLLGLDQFVNTILGGNEDETISSRVGRHAVAGERWALICERVINAIFWFSPDHCRKAIEWDEVEGVSLRG
jgi:hypothetical protein